MTLPNFLICGAPKAGTTALHHILNQHPDIYMSREKETDFFQHNYSKGLNWFTDFFTEHQGESAVGEASPGNMIHPDAAERIAKHIPDAKLIFMLRNPIERAFSQYLYGIYLGMESPNDSFTRIIRDPKHEWGQRIVELGMYYEQLKKYEAYFPREQMLVLFYEDFKSQPQEVLKQIFEFIGVDPTFEPEQKKHNATNYPKNMTIYRTVYQFWDPVKKILGDSLLSKTQIIRSKVRDLLYQSKNSKAPELPMEDKKYLLERYQESIENLSTYLHRDLSQWLQINEPA